MDFKSELNTIKCKTIPSSVSKLIDNGLIQDCEELDNVYYITFGFRIKDKPIYNYELSNFYSNFAIKEYCSVIYCGGLAINSKSEILRGIIYPYYFDYQKDSILLENPISGISEIVSGTPQIITKNMKIKLSDCFTSLGFKLYNVITDKSNSWEDFIKNKENYNNCRVYSENYTIIEPEEGIDSNFYGYCYDWRTGSKMGTIYRYNPVFVSLAESVPLNYITDFIKNDTLNKNIVANIYCANAISHSIKNAGNDIKKGLNNVSAAVIINGEKNKTGLNNIANEKHLANGYPYKCY